MATTKRMTQTQLVRSLAEQGEVTNKQAEEAQVADMQQVEDSGNNDDLARGGFFDHNISLSHDMDSISAAGTRPRRYYSVKSRPAACAVASCGVQTR